MSFVHFRYVHQVDAVLLSHPDPIHLGALPYAVGKLGLNCTIYATIPVYKMGQMFMYDLYQVGMDCEDVFFCFARAWLYEDLTFLITPSFQSRNNSEDFQLFTLDDVDSAFDKIQQLKYSQIVNLKGEFVLNCNVSRVSLVFLITDAKMFCIS